MTDTKKDEQILKTDVLGRITMPRERREKILDEFEKSGLSGKQFAHLAGINYQTFATWVQKRRRQRKQYPVLSKTKPTCKRLARVQWLEAVVEQKKLPAGSIQSVLVVRLPGGAQLEVGDANQAALAVVLRKRCTKRLLTIDRWSQKCRSVMPRCL